jgi:hypothetical protein
MSFFGTPPGAGALKELRSSNYPETASGAVRGHGQTPSGYLTARPPSRTGSERDDYCLYDLVINREVIVTGSRTPEFDACRILLARGLTGKVAIFDSTTKKLRLTVDIEAGARLACYR